MYMSEMLPVAGEEFQVFQSVVGFVSVPMVNDLARGERSTQMPCHHGTMLFNVGCVGVDHRTEDRIGAVDADPGVPVPSSETTALPGWIKGTKLPTQLCVKLD